MPTKPWKDLEGHYFRIDVGSTAAAAMQGDPYTIYYTTEGYIVLNGEMMGRTITDDSSPTQVIDLSALDPNTWYPVTCILPENLPTNVLTIKHNLWGWAGPIPPWASHSSGFYAFMRVTCNPSRWGANVAKSLVTHNANQYVKGASPIFFKRTTYSNVTDRNQSCAIFYLRGGTTYHGSIQIGNDLEIEKQYLAPWAVHPDGFTDTGSKETYLPISDTSKLPANIPDVPARLDSLESSVKTKAEASAVYDRATVDRLLAAKQNAGNYVTAIGRMYPGGGPGLNVTLSSGAAQGISVADNANESRDGYMSAADYKLLHQGVLKNSLLPEVYEQAHRNGRLQVTQTVTIPDYAKEIHILQSSNIEVRIPSAMQENGYGITFYCEGHTGTATIRSTVPMWYLNANGRIAQSNRLVMTFGSALCITWRGGSRTAIQLSPVPITPA